MLRLEHTLSLKYVVSQGKLCYFLTTAPFTVTRSFAESVRSKMRNAFAFQLIRRNGSERKAFRTDFSLTTNAKIFVTLF